MAGPEVVHADPDAHGPQLHQDGSDRRGPFLGDAFGQLQYQAARIKAGLEQGVRDLGNELRLEKLHAGDVDRHPQVVRGQLSRLLPRLELRARFAQYPHAQRQDEAGFLRDGNEIQRGHQAEDRVLPPRQGLEADDRVRHDRHHRLVEHLELAPVERPHEVGLQLQLGANRFEPAGVEELAARLPQTLGPMQRGLRVAQHLVRVGIAGCAHGDPDACRQQDVARP